MKKITMLLALILTMLMVFSLAACSGSDTKATEAAKETEAAETEAEKETEAPAAAFDFPLDHSNALDYFIATYGVSMMDVEELKVKEKSDTIVITYKMNGKYEMYVLNREDGELVDKQIGLDELPTEAPTEDTRDVYQKAIDAGYEALRTSLGIEFTADSNPTNLKTKKDVDGVITVYMTYDGINYEFLYDEETDTCTQLKP